MFTLSLSFIRTSEGIWFYLCWAACVPLIMFRKCVHCVCVCVYVFSLSRLSSPDLSPTLSFLFVVQVRVHPHTPRQPHGHILVCRYADAGKSGQRCTPQGSWPTMIHPTALRSGLGPSRLPKQVTGGLSIPEMRLRTGMKRNVWSELGCVTMFLCL